MDLMHDLSSRKVHTRTQRKKKELGMTRKINYIEIKSIHLGNIELNNNQILDHR